jgi:hypothetical protein
MMMKNVLLGVALLAASLAHGAAKPADYSGAWALDMKQSRNLPPFYANVKSHKLVVRQDAGHLLVAVKVEDGGAEPFKINFDYNLDGTETKAETQMRTPSGMRAVPTALKAEAAADGGLHITITREMRTGESAFKAVTAEDWRLSADGKTLNIHRADDTPRGKYESEMVFVKG